MSAKLDEPNGLNGQVHELTVQVASANGELKAIRGLWEDQLKKTGTLKLQAFKALLPQTNETLTAAQTLAISTSKEVLKSMRLNFLAIDPSAIGYWPAVSRFIACRSQQEASKAALLLLKPRPVYSPPESCNSQIPSTAIKPGESKKEPLPAVLEQCIFDLSEDIPPWWVNLKAMDYGVGGFRFEDCVINYEGGPSRPSALTKNDPFVLG